MASPSSDRDRSDAKDHLANPFIAFRHFADAQMSSLMNSVFGAFESSPIRRQQAIEEYEALLRRSREEGSDHLRSQSTVDHEVHPRGDHIRNRNNSSSEMEKENDKEPFVGGQGRGLEDEELPYEDDDYYLPRSERLPQLLDPLQVLLLMKAWRLCDRIQPDMQEDSINGDRPDFSSLPRHDFCDLVRRAFVPDEQESQMEDQSSDPHRLHFCDLIRRLPVTKEQVPQIKHQTSDERSNLDSDRGDPPLRTICDALGVDRRKEDFGHWEEEDEEECEERRAKDGKMDETPASELDLYHALSSPHVDHKRPLGAKFEEQAKGDSKPSILSTLTTTERRTLPDGSSTTKIVLKKRFSDGVEEVTENFHTQSPLLPQMPVNTQSITKQDADSKKPKDEKRSGWFWS